MSSCSVVVRKIWSRRIIRKQERLREVTKAKEDWISNPSEEIEIALSEQQQDGTIAGEGSNFVGTG